LASAGVSRLTLANRSLKRAQDVVDEVSRSLPGRAAITAADLGSELTIKRVLNGCDLVINCTPVGMHPLTGFSPLASLQGLPQHCVVADTIYNPRRTKLMDQAEACGLRTIGGQGMLVHQAALAWKIWFGRLGPVDTMTRALDQALGVNRDPDSVPLED
jgi:shikimate dehydrogenase